MDRIPALRFEDLEMWQQSHQLTLRIGADARPPEADEVSRMLAAYIKPLLPIP